MKALIFQGKQKVEFSSVTDPVIVQPTDVIVKVKLCAICGSDLHVYHEHEKGLDHSTAMGHEFTGEVVEVGRDIKTLKIGDHVMSPFSTSCGECFYCKLGLTSRCVFSQLFGWRENGKGLHGGQAEYVRVPLAEHTLIKTPDGISTEHALLLGDIIPTGYFCAMQANILPQGTYAVVGCGPVGLMAILGTRIQGGERIFAIDTVPERLEVARQFGAIPLNPRHVDPLATIHENNDGRGVDAVMEAVGNNETGKLAYRLVRPGGIISMVGVCTDQHMPFSPTDAYNKNLTFKVGRCPARFLMDRLIPVVQSDKYNFTKIISHRMSLSDGTHGYDIFANKKDNCLKVVLS
jgi:2-desacetyl-2-hydroxyethyl bacteriochlorophyllide A dehydrogenase